MQALLTHISGVTYYVLDKVFVMHKNCSKTSKDSRQKRRRETDGNQVLFCSRALPKLLKAHKRNFTALVDMASFCKRKYHVDSWKLTKEIN